MWSAERPHPLSVKPCTRVLVGFLHASLLAFLIFSTPSKMDILDASLHRLIYRLGCRAAQLTRQTPQGIAVKAVASGAVSRAALKTSPPVCQAMP